MDPKEQLLRDFYAARARRDWPALRAWLADDVVWHELGPEQGYSGDHQGRETVAALLEDLVAQTGGTFSLEPTGIVTTAEHAAASVRWSAERDGTRVDGYDLAVYRIADGEIAEAWFFPDGFDPEALTAVFSRQGDSS
jgi:ketosteroid isomerase-like protein